MLSASAKERKDSLEVIDIILKGFDEQTLCNLCLSSKEQLLHKVVREAGADTMRARPTDSMLTNSLRPKDAL